MRDTINRILVALLIINLSYALFDIFQRGDFLPADNLIISIVLLILLSIKH